MYKLVKPLFFTMNAEKAHHTVTGGLKTFLKVWGTKAIAKQVFSISDPSLEREVFGLRFKNPVGLAAGFDKNAEFVDEFNHLGFGFVEIGTVTPRPQLGNEKPRMFRLPKDDALINRMGFNNQGVDVAALRLEYFKDRKGLLVGGNIGKNKDTPNSEAVNDYLICFEKLFDVVDYFVVNVSSPNTPGLRELQEKEPLTHILKSLQEKNHLKENPKPILLKIAPDLSDSQLDDIVDIVKDTSIAGVIATNTTISRDGLESDKNLTNEVGGLSGKPLAYRSTEVIRYLAEKSNHSFPIIGVGGIYSAEEALAKMQAGATLVQLYTGLIYEGPGLVKKICKKLIKKH